VNYNVVSNITNIKSDIISRAFGYDNLDRLTSYDQNATDFQNFVYDANGNRLNQDQENNETKVFSYALNSNILNGIEESNATDTTNISYEYDKTGNIIKDDKHVYTYDSRNRLTAIDSNVTYQYNYDNKRVSKTVNGVKTYFVYDGHMLIGEYQLNLSDDSRQEYVYLNSTPIATLNPQENYRIYADHLDTSRRVATNDEYAEIMWKWESKPFGESTATGIVSLNLRFPGQYFDAETSTHYNINRDYNPVTGRYIQSDPIGFDGGVNGFGYVNGQPTTGADMYGLWCWPWESCNTVVPAISKAATYLNLIAFGPKITSDFERKMIHRWIYNLGNYTLTYQEFSEILNGSTFSFVSDGVILVNTYNLPKYDFAIGRATAYYDTYTNQFNGFYDYFDFDPKAWGVRSTKAELATRAGASLEYISSATPFIIKYP
jgi:RHS repeat-associated protein